MDHGANRLWARLTIWNAVRLRITSTTSAAKAWLILKKDVAN
jgi:hypothetical protein